MTPDNIDTLRDQWAQANDSLRPLADRTAEFSRIARMTRATTARDRLHRTFTRMLILLAFAAVSWPLYVMMGIFEPQYTTVMTIVGTLFFATLAAEDISMLVSLRRLDPATLPINDFISGTLRLRRRHIIFEIVNTPFGIAFLWFMAYALNANDPGEREAMLIAMTIGGVAGLAIGIVTLVNIMRGYRQMAQALD